MQALTLYHTDPSVCSIKARIALAEKNLPWQEVQVSLQGGEQFKPEYLKLNPEAVVPTLVHGDRVVRESSVIAAYVDRLSAENILMPTEDGPWSIANMWLIRSIDIHASINTMSFATAFRERDIATKTTEQIENSIERLLSPQIREKRWDMYKEGVNSIYVDSALRVLTIMLRDMNDALSKTKWLAQDKYTIADLALTSYVDRLERFAMAGLWSTRFPEVSRWLKNVQSRNSYTKEVHGRISESDAKTTFDYAQRSWPILAERISSRDFTR